MPRSLLSLLFLLLITVANFFLFISRWAEPAVKHDLTILTFQQVNSLVVGASIAFFVGSCIRLIQAQKWLTLLVYLVLGGAFARNVQFLESAAPLLRVERGLGVLGFLVIVVFFLRRAEGDSELDIGDRWRYWKRATATYFLLTLNFFLLIAPLTAHIPTIVQERAEMFFGKLTYSSIDSDRSPVFGLMRRAINLLFPAVSINSSGLVSIITISGALAFSALAARIMFGRTWASVFLLFCLTDKWIVGAGVASSGLGQPLLLISTTVALTMWAWTRPARVLTWKESLYLGAFISLGVVFSLYSYSVGRITWMFGWLLIGSTLIVRGILPLRLSSLWHVLRMSVPSVIALFLIFWLAFKGDADRFRGELFAAPEPWRMIEHPSKVGENLRIFTDGDAPIWLGSAFDDGRNTLYHWRRTPAELLEAVIGYFKRVDGMNHVAAYLALLTIAGISVAFAGPSNFRRKVGVLSVYFLVFSYAPMLLSQDHSAYRRGMYTEVTMMLLITGAFAALGRLNQKVPLAIVPAVGLALIKAPLELQPLFTDEMHTPMCVMCHSEAGVPLKRLVTDPQFVALQSRSLRFLVNPSDVAELQSSCMEMALQSWEMSKLVPLGKMIEGVPGDLMATYQQLNPGDILVLLCTRGERAHIRNPDLIAACDGESRIGRILGRTQPESWVWFTFIEKTMS